MRPSRKVVGNVQIESLRLFAAAKTFRLFLYPDFLGVNKPRAFGYQLEFLEGTPVRCTPVRLDELPVTLFFLGDVASRTAENRIDYPRPDLRYFPEDPFDRDELINIIRTDMPDTGFFWKV